MVDRYDNPVISGGSTGLLLYNGGTVCDDGFGDEEATVSLLSNSSVSLMPCKLLPAGV